MHVFGDCQELLLYDHPWLLLNVLLCHPSLPSDGYYCYKVICFQLLKGKQTAGQNWGHKSEDNMLQCLGH